MPPWFFIGTALVVALAIFEYFGLKKMKSKNDVYVAELELRRAEAERETAQINLRAAELDARIRPTLQQNHP